MPDLDPESLARRAGVDAITPCAGYPDWDNTPYYSAPAVAAMLKQYRREVIEECAHAVEDSGGDNADYHARYVRRLAEKG